MSELDFDDGIGVVSGQCQWFDVSLCRVPLSAVTLSSVTLPGSCIVFCDDKSQDRLVTDKT